MRTYPRLFLKPNREKAILTGHPWIFSGAVASVEGTLPAGTIVQAVSSQGRPLALGFYHPRGDIAFRVLTLKPDAVVDRNFFLRRILQAIALRERTLPPDTTAYRLINAEGDQLPGLVVDRYGDYLVLCLATSGMEAVYGDLIDILLSETKARGIYERSEGKARQMEGLAERIGVVYGSLPPVVEIGENGLSFLVDVVSGQKTGFFLDQRVNRELARRLARGGEVLNCFSYSGAFSVYAAAGGARRVVSVDTSPAANLLARQNWELNRLPSDRHLVVAADVFDYLRRSDELFDLVILDPPALAKSKKDVARAARGYKDINLQGIRRLKEGGLLLTFSCSNYVDQALFEKIVRGAACDAGKKAQLLAQLGAGPDHPLALGHGEGRYLKGLLIGLGGW